MDGYAFIDGIFKSLTMMIGALAWPASIFGIVWLFRQKLNALLPSLILKHKDWQISFGLDKAEEQAKQLPPPPKDVTLVMPSYEEQRRELEFARESPQGAIVVKSSRLEIAVREFAKAVGALRPDMPFTALIELLKDNKLADEKTLKLLGELEAVGALARHGLSEPTWYDAMRYQILANQMIDRFTVAVAAAKMPPPGPIPQGTP
jgi:hypothetical protein